MTLVVYVKHMKKSKWLDCQGNEFFPKQKGTPSLVKIEHKNTATLDSARSKKKSKVAVLQLVTIIIPLRYAFSHCLTTKQTAFLLPLEIPFSELACDFIQVKERWECSIGEITFLAKLAYSTLM